MLLNCVGRVVFAEYLFLKCKAIFSGKDVENTSSVQKQMLYYQGDPKRNKLTKEQDSYYIEISQWIYGENQMNGFLIMAL